MPETELTNALRTLSEAAHTAIETGKDTTEYPMLDRQKLRQIAALTDEMVRQPMVLE